ncbi:SurA N-terminal domain-containing protein [Kitasatospora sp. NPDC058965]|uniref:SurA N-terminal domain-containing protein n=1 Tax=Kitasatospora sp. NPDC058965 TaxID=3346682 RepID=UPI00367DF29B
MNRRTTARRIAGTALAALALAGCGARGGGSPGTAALVGGDRITEQQVQARVTEFRAQAAELPTGQYQEQAGLVGTTVAAMVFDQVAEHAMAGHGLAVSPAEVAAYRADQARTWGGEPALAQMLLLKHAVPAGEIDRYCAEQVGLRKLAEQSGQQLGTTEGNRTVHQLLAQASTELRIAVNPRYGVWDPQQSVLDGPADSWLPATGAAA